MKRILLRVTIGAAAVAVVLCLAGLAGWTLITRRIAARMQPPHLEYQPAAASDLIFRTMDGRTEHLSSFRGQVIVLDLWGTWCIQCVAEMPTVQKLYDHYRNDPQVRFLIVSRMDSPEAVRLWAQRHNLHLPFYVMRDEDIPASMRLDQYPATFLYEKDGKLAAEHVGAADWSAPSVSAFIDRLKAEP